MPPHLPAMSARPDASATELAGQRGQPVSSPREGLDPNTHWLLVPQTFGVRVPTHLPPQHCISQMCTLDSVSQAEEFHGSLQAFLAYSLSRPSRRGHPLPLGSTANSPGQGPTPPEPEPEDLLSLLSHDALPASYPPRGSCWVRLGFRAERHKKLMSHQAEGGPQE